MHGAVRPTLAVPPRAVLGGDAAERYTDEAAGPERDCGQGVVEWGTARVEECEWRRGVRSPAGARPVIWSHFARFVSCFICTTILRGSCNTTA